MHGSGPRLAQHSLLGRENGKVGGVRQVGGVWGEVGGVRGQVGGVWGGMGGVSRMREYFRLRNSGLPCSPGRGSDVGEGGGKGGRA